MAIVYVVTTGDYSDYHICGVYDDRTLAEKASAMVRGEIDEWELNDHADALRLGHRLWRVRCVVDGEEVYAHELSFGLFDAQEIHPLGGSPLTGWECSLFARDAEHATKIATDMRAEWLARREGVG